MAETDTTGNDMGADGPEVTLTCPWCGSQAVLPIKYGLRYPEYDMHMGEPTMVLGGCIVHANAPAWSCQSCAYRWGRSTYYREITEGASTTSDVAADFDAEIVWLEMVHGDEALPVPARLTQTVTADLFTRAGIQASERYRRAWRDQGIIAHIALADGERDSVPTVGEIIRIVAWENRS
jgi:hypothetical protein